jgi:hypothetical protein
MAEEKKQEVREFKINEEELNTLLAFVGKRPLEEALQAFGILQGIVQRPIEEKLKRRLKKTE